MIWALAYLITYRPLFILLGLLFTVTGSADIAYAIEFNGIFTTSSVEAIAQTNASEAFEFIQSYFSISAFLIIIFYLIASLFLLNRFTAPGFSHKKAYKLSAIGFFAIFALLIVDGIVIKHKYGKRLPGIIGAYPEFLKGNLSLSKEIQQREQLVSNTSYTFTNNEDLPQTYVFIIGESASRTHMSLYGYQRETNHQLGQRDDLLLFDNVISNYVQTLPSLRITLTSADSLASSSHAKSLSVVDAANLAGFETWWISNQQPLRGTYSAVGYMAKKTIFISNEFFGNETHRFDNHVLPKLDLALASEAPKKAIFIHLMGSHLKYDKRYPKSFSKFNAPPYYGFKQALSDTQKSYIDSYDNSILFSDWITNNAIEKLNHKALNDNGLYSLTYIADHGEEVFDSADFKGHGPDNVTPGMVEIPFITWLSKSFISNRGSQVDQLRQNKSAPAMLDSFFYFALDMMNIESDLNNKTKSLFSDQYLPKNRMVYGIDYDHTMKKQSPLITKLSNQNNK
ncbi:phosphoethanolamine transferase CptA [Amphritea balenae]|nr:phosphoethanolamine transferase CptA [Amphritea balenae]